MSPKSENLGWAVVVSFPLTLIQLIWVGFVLSILWNWFVPEVFISAPRISVVQAIGLNLVASIFMMKNQYDSDKDVWESMLTSFFFVLFSGIILLFFGYFVHAAM